MKTIKQSRNRPFAIVHGLPPSVRRPEDEDRSTRYAFYFLMTTLALGLIYFLLMPFFI